MSFYAKCQFVYYFIKSFFHIRNLKENKKILINHKLPPILLAKNGNIWLASCIVSLSSHKTAGNIEARILGEMDYWTYSIESCKWEKESNIKLNDREKDILTLSDQGGSEGVNSKWAKPRNLRGLFKRKKNLLPAEENSCCFFILQTVPSNLFPILQWLQALWRRA